MSLHNETLYRVALKNIPKVGAVIARNLVSYCGSVEAIFHERPSRLRKIPGVGPTLISYIRNKSVLLEAEKELKHIEKNDISLYFYLDDNYPKRLAQISQAPILMYSKGNMDLNAERIISIVGTRKPTHFGRRICQALVKDIARYNPMIVSGLAYGIDVEAHQSALTNGLSTVAVLGNGLGKIYPNYHIPIAKKMQVNGGLLTEFNYETLPAKDNFPSRNRIVAAISDLVVVIESADRGGSIITAEFANAYNRDVAAVPGRASDEMSAGCNRLIKTHKAHLIEKGDDIAQLLGWDDADATKKPMQSELFATMSDAETLILSIIGDEKACELDTLTAQSRMPLSELATVLLSLELKGVVKALPGKRYVKFY